MGMHKSWTQLLEDVTAQSMMRLPSDIKKLDKFRISYPSNGMRISWYYEEDKRFAGQHPNEFTLREFAPYSGILVLMPNRDTGRPEWDDFIVCVDDYPTEKCYPISDMVALGRLLEVEELVEVFELGDGEEVR